MNTPDLTQALEGVAAATTKHPIAGSGDRRWQLVVWSGITMAMCGVVSGCITVNAPSKPIVIELNINIKQEVVYRLAADAGKTIDSNKEIF
jgi:hypothetical protein